MSDIVAFVCAHAGTVLSMLGLIADIGGFVLIGIELLKHPGQRLFYGGGTREYRRDLWGFGLVVLGFALQLLGQIVSILG